MIDAKMNQYDHSDGNHNDREGPLPHSRDLVEDREGDHNVHNHCAQIHLGSGRGGHGLWRLRLRDNAKTNQHTTDREDHEEIADGKHAEVNPVGDERGAPRPRDLAIELEAAQEDGDGDHQRQNVLNSLSNRHHALTNHVDRHVDVLQGVDVVRQEGDRERRVPDVVQTQHQRHLSSDEQDAVDAAHDAGEQEDLLLRRQILVALVSHDEGRDGEDVNHQHGSIDHERRKHHHPPLPRDYRIDTKRQRDYL